jgi:hypothetical protein
MVGQVYRCWIIYEKSWRVVAFPMLLWLGTAACTAMNIQIEANLHSHALITSGSLQPVIISFWVLTITQNILTTGQSSHAASNTSGTHYIHSIAYFSYLSNRSTELSVYISQHLVGQ